MSSDTIWVTTDTSVSGVGAVYVQGTDWQSCRPAGFMSKKFMAAQQHYRTYEQETLTMIEVLAKWSDKLLGCKFMIVTNHKALEFFNNQSNLTLRQTRWSKYLRKYNADIHYVKGRLNKVADCFSRYYESLAIYPSNTKYISMDARLDPDGDDLIEDHCLEIRAMESHDHSIIKPCPQVPNKVTNQAPQLRMERDTEAAILEEHVQWPVESPSTMAKPGEREITPTDALNIYALLGTMIESEHSNWLKAVGKGFNADLFFKRILANPTHYEQFEYNKTTSLLWGRNSHNERVLCIPNGTLEGQSL